MRKHRADLLIGVLSAILMAAGLLVIFAVGPRVAQFENSQSDSSFSESYFFTHHLIAVIMTVGAMIAAYLLPYEKLARHGLRILVAGFILCALVFVLGKMGGAGGLVTCDEGACRSFHVPGIGMGFQPVEIVKVGVLFYVGWLIKKRKEQGLMDKGEFWIPIAVIAGLTGILVAVGLKDFGSTVVIFTMLAAMMWVGGVNLKYFGIALAVGLGAAILMIITSSHRLARLASFGESYHVENALISLGTGGLFGVGMGNSIQSTGYLPEALSDSIIAIIGEVLGFVGTISVMIIFAVILMRMISVAKRTGIKEQSLFVVGVTAWIFAHVIINVGGMTGLIPVKGITLPFLSYGGTSMVFVGFALGMVLQISGWARREVVSDGASAVLRRRKKIGRSSRGVRSSVRESSVREFARESSARESASVRGGVSVREGEA